MNNEGIRKVRVLHHCVLPLPPTVASAVTAVTL